MSQETPPVVHQPPRTCTLAIVSLIAGILGFCIPIVGPALAIVFGVLALGKIKSSFGALAGRGMAIAGIALGAIWVCFIPVMAILAGMLLPALAMARAEARQVKCMANVRIMLTACHDYAAAHDDALPTELADLQPYLPSSNSLICPETADESEPSYELALQEGDAAAAVSNLKLSELPPETVILREKQPNHVRGRVVGHADGSVEVVQDDPDGFRRESN